MVVAEKDSDAEHCMPDRAGSLGPVWASTIPLPLRTRKNVIINTACHNSDGVPSCGVRLLTKAKEFHVVARGLRERSGHCFVASKTPR